MKLTRIIIYYLILGSVAGLISSLYNQNSINKWLSPLLYFASLMFSIWLLRIRNEKNVSNYLVAFFLLQLFFIRMKGFGFAFATGLSFFANYKFNPFSLNQTIFSTAYSNFIGSSAGQPFIIGFNLIALFFISLILTTRK